MHGDGPGMSVGEAVEEHYFSPTNNSPAAGSGASGSTAAGGTLQGFASLPTASAAGRRAQSPAGAGRVSETDSLGA